MNNNKNILFEKFISQESPLSSIEFLDDTNENIIDQFKVIIDINKKDSIKLVIDLMKMLLQ